MNRRDALRTMGAGFGTLGLINVLHAEAATVRLRRRLRISRRKPSV